MTKRNKILAIGAGLIVAHLILREYRKREATINYVDDLPLNHNAVTIPPLGIFIKQSQMDNEALLKHELVHWKQYQRMGLLRYYYNYLQGLIRDGYDLHPMEQEARAGLENEFCRVNYTECVRNGHANTVHDPDFRKLTLSK